MSGSKNWNLSSIKGRSFNADSVAQALIDAGWWVSENVPTATVTGVNVSYVDGEHSVEVFYENVNE